MTSKKPRIAVVLSGCGVYDGAEIHESVLVLLAIDQHGGEYRCFAPDQPQHHVVDHRTGQECGETRNALTEAARIARGDIADLAQYRAVDFDALVLPGGFGAAKNLCSFATEGPNCTVDAEMERVLKETHAAGKPIGASCIAPVVLARAFGEITVTIGDDPATAAAVEEMGAHHQNAGHGEVVVDDRNRIVTTPCYMLKSTISQIAQDAEALVDAVIAMSQ